MNVFQVILIVTTLEKGLFFFFFKERGFLAYSRFWKGFMPHKMCTMISMEVLIKSFFSALTEVIHEQLEKLELYKHYIDKS